MQNIYHPCIQQEYYHFTNVTHLFPQQLAVFTIVHLEKVNFVIEESFMMLLIKMIRKVPQLWPG